MAKAGIGSYSYIDAGPPPSGCPRWARRKGHETCPGPAGALLGNFHAWFHTNR